MHVSDGGANLSAIGKHLLDNSAFSIAYTDSSFSVLCRAHTFTELKVLEAVYIQILKPNLCIQKESVTTLSLFT